MSDGDSAGEPARGSSIKTGARGNDPGGWGFSMANFEPLMTALFEAVGARSIVEVGAFAGDLTRVLHRWCEANGATVAAVDPAPEPALRDLAERTPGIELVVGTGVQALSSIELPDAAVIDSDHNYFTLSGELAAIGEGTAADRFPLLIFHDVGWPHGRRDSFYVPERIPEDERGEIAADVTLFPGEPGLAPGGLPFPWAATREGGPRNGVLTAIEDFVAARPELRLAVVPGFFGMGILWSRQREYADSVRALAEAWTANPILEPLEDNRIFNLAARHDAQAKVEHLESEYHLLADRFRRRQRLLEQLEASRALGLLDRLGSLRGGSRQGWRKRIQDSLREDR